MRDQLTEVKLQLTRIMQVCSTPLSTPKNGNI